MLRHLFVTFFALVLAASVFGDASAKIRNRNLLEDKATVSDHASLTVDGKKLTVEGYNVQQVGSYDISKEQKYVFIKGNTCTSCNAPDVLGVHLLPLDGDSHSLAKKSYAYPGKTATGESRAFYGKCLPGNKAVLVWHGNTVNEKGQKKKFVKAYGLTPLGLKERSVRQGLPVSVLEKRVKQGACKEIPAAAAHGA